MHFSISKNITSSFSDYPDLPFTELFMFPKVAEIFTIEIIWFYLFECSILYKNVILKVKCYVWMERG